MAYDESEEESFDRDNDDLGIPDMVDGDDDLPSDEIF